MVKSEDLVKRVTPSLGPSHGQLRKAYVLSMLPTCCSQAAQTPSGAQGRVPVPAVQLEAGAESWRGQAGTVLSGS